MSPARFGAFVAAVFVLTAAAVASAGPPVTDVPALIDKLTEVADSDIGYSPVAWGRSSPSTAKVPGEAGFSFRSPKCRRIRSALSSSKGRRPCRN